MHANFDYRLVRLDDVTFEASGELADIYKVSPCIWQENGRFGHEIYVFGVACPDRFAIERHWNRTREMPSDMEPQAFRFLVEMGGLERLTPCKSCKESGSIVKLRLGIAMQDQLPSARRPA
jgi:hypothetical protein